MKAQFVQFRVHYWTQWGENLGMEIRSPGRPGEDDVVGHAMVPATEGFWEVRLPAAEFREPSEYRYVVRDQRGVCRREPVFRRPPGSGVSVVHDAWFVSELPEAAFLRQAFAGVIFNPVREAAPPLVNAGGPVLRLTLRAPRVVRGTRICVTGSHPRLGGWDPARARVMDSREFPLWTLDLPAGEMGGRVEFKFGLWDEGARRLVEYEAGGNRSLPEPEVAEGVEVVNCEHFRHAALWKGAGVAIPVFSLRSEAGYGIGEFRDLAGFAAWAAAAGLQMVQLLPVNDTSSDFTWHDSYPYKAISTAALHPIYLHVDAVFREHGVALPAELPAQRAALNRLPHVDYEQVLRHKLGWLRQLFGRIRERVLGQPEFAAYLRDEASWLEPYAAFCVLRDRHGTADFTRWGEDAACRAPAIREWFGPGAAERPELMFHCWLQYELDRQLQAAIASGHACGVAFKGDLPIGIDRCSVEAWVDPGLFRLDRQTGAPPDAFAVLGQNWGFPTYNWERMERDGFAWWRRRLQRMSRAFDALRIDHILGFFRIWEIPAKYRDGIMGHYHPARPLTEAEIRNAGFPRPVREFVVGAVPARLIEDLFGPRAAPVRNGLIEAGADGFHRLRPGMELRDVRQRWCEASGFPEAAAAIEQGIERLGREVLFLEDPDEPGRYHPRFNLTDVALFRELPVAEQAALAGLHDDFFHRRHTEFWADVAMKRLPALMDASSMLICGEDLGLVPDCVPVVLSRLGLLSLEVQRWPKQAGQRFSDPVAYPYMSVSTTSTHDMSTVRGWWEEEPETREAYWSEVMERDGEAPAECRTDICRFVVEQNLAGASMWCILPLQDWLGLDPVLRHPVAADERINVPKIPRHYWRYRMHLTIEELQEARSFRELVRGLVCDSGRSTGTAAAAGA